MASYGSARPDKLECIPVYLAHRHATFVVVSRAAAR